MHVRAGGKAAHHVVRAAIVDNHVTRAQIDVDSATVKRVLQRLSGNASDELRGLKASCLVDEIQDWIIVNVEDACIKNVIKVNVIT